MTDSQRKFYLHLAFKAAVASGVRYNDELWRHEQVANALGCEKRFKDFTNADLDKVIAHFKGIINPDSFDPAEFAADAGERKRLLYVIEQLQDKLGQRYAAKILFDRFKLVFTEEFAATDLPTLRQIRATFTARLHARQTRDPVGANCIRDPQPVGVESRGGETCEANPSYESNPTQPEETHAHQENS